MSTFVPLRPPARRLLLREAARRSSPYGKSGTAAYAKAYYEAHKRGGRSTGEGPIDAVFTGTDEVAAERFFRRTLEKQWSADDLWLYHEAPGQQLPQLRRGVEDGLFAAIGEPSGFVRGEKTVVRVKPAYTELDRIRPDAGTYNGVNDTTPYLNALNANGGRLRGMYVYFAGPIEGSRLRSAAARGPALDHVVLRSIAAARGSISPYQLEALLTDRQYGELDQIVDGIVVRFAAALRPALERDLLEELLRQTSKDQEILPPLRTADLGVSFKRSNPEALAWAAERAAQLVTLVTEETRRALRAIITRAFTEFIPPREAAKLIMPNIGLTERFAGAVLRLRTALLGSPGRLVRAGKLRYRVPAEGISAEKLADYVGKYAQRLLRVRAENIARTETLAASNAGQRFLWKEAQRQELLDSTQQRKWISTRSSGRTCPTCAAMSGQMRGLDDPFTLPDGTAVMNPPAHPSCRCGQGLADPLAAIASLEAKLRDAARRERLPIPFKPGTREYAKYYYEHYFKKKKGAVAAAPASPEQQTPEQKLKSPINSAERLGGGVSVTKKVVLANGEVGVFKPADGEPPDMRENVEHGFQTEREVAAWEVAKAAGFDDLVAPTVETVYLGKRGSLQAWQAGRIAGKTDERDRFDGPVDAERAAMYDFVIGNTDRHSGNWIVSPDKKLRLIDHGLAFPESNGGGANLRFLERQRERAYDHAIAGQKAPSPELVQQVLGARTQIVSAARSAGLPPRSIAAMLTRIDHLKDAPTWSSMTHVFDYPSRPKSIFAGSPIKPVPR